MSEIPASRQSRPRPVSARARLRPKSQLTLPEEVRRALRISEGDEVEFRVEENGTITVKGYISVPTDHAWLYEAHPSAHPASARELAGRPTAVHESAGALFAHLEQVLHIKKSLDEHADHAINLIAFSGGYALCHFFLEHTDHRLDLLFPVEHLEKDLRRDIIGEIADDSEFAGEGFVDVQDTGVDKLFF